DIAFSVCAIVLLAVPTALLCAFIALGTPGVPVCSRERVGRGGGSSRVLRLRSRVADGGDVAKHLSAEQLAQWERERKVDGDPRVTSLGRLIRATSLDELPQFLNVLKGDMSVVGPRPVTRDELAWFGEDAEEYLS